MNIYTILLKIVFDRAAPQRTCDNSPDARPIMKSRTRRAKRGWRSITVWWQHLFKTSTQSYTFLQKQATVFRGKAPKTFFW